MMARRNPARAPRNPSVMERLLKVRRPWPVRRNPVYAITAVQTIARTFTGPHTPAGFSKVISTVPPPAHLHYFRSACDGNTGNPVCGRQPKPATRRARAANSTLWALAPYARKSFFISDVSENGGSTLAGAPPTVKVSFSRSLIEGSCESGLDADFTVWPGVFSPDQTLSSPIRSRATPTCGCTR